MDEDIFKYKRKSYLEIGEIFFWTATINSWRHLLKEDKFKDVIIDSLQTLTDRGKIDVFAFVIMPNHMHLIWRINELNGKESSQGSFLKFTAHEFKRMLRYNNHELSKYAVKARNKDYEFWQRDPLGIHLYSREVAFQKLDYIHANPVAEHWQLVDDPCDYVYSSASYYERDKKNFKFLKDLRDEF